MSRGKVPSKQNDESIQYLPNNPLTLFYLFLPSSAKHEATPPYTKCLHPTGRLMPPLLGLILPILLTQFKQSRAFQTFNSFPYLTWINYRRLLRRTRKNSVRTWSPDHNTISLDQITFPVSFCSYNYTSILLY